MSKQNQKVRKGNNSRTNNKNLIIRGARVHNLKNIDLQLPRNKLIVFTGVSGSGKSSLAFDTIYAEGQRRFVESLSAYARQFLERMDKPDVDFIEGLSPAIAIEQRTTTRNPRSTVGTSTEIYDYLRILFARVGKTYCYNCGKVVQKDSIQTVLEKLNAETDNKEETKLYIMFPLQLHPKATVKQEIENLKKQGFVRLFCKGQLIELNDKLPPKTCKSDISIVVDRLIYRKNGNKDRLTDSIETAFKVSGGHATIHLVEEEKDIRFNQHFNCANCGIDYETPDPRLFSFNSPFGACPVCQGFGRSIGIDLNLVIPDRTKTISQGAILPWTTPKWKKYLDDLMEVADEYDIRVDVPFFELTKIEIDLVLNGSAGFDGVYDFFRYIERKSYKIHYRYFLSRFRGYTVCEMCKGARLRREATYVKVEGKSISEIVRMTVSEAYDFFDNLKLTEFELEIAKRVLEEIKRRLKYMVDIGVSYLSLDRLTSTLSGGESQRINLATSLGSSLVGSMYVLDEPSIGLHPRDNNRLIDILKSLRDIGNTVIVVEHDGDMMRAADCIVDLGPGAGDKGGSIVFNGTYDEILKSNDSITGKYLRGKLGIPLPVKRRKGTIKKLIINGASEHNLKGIDVEIPLNKFVCITGVSGSGKSTLIMEVLYPALKKLKQSTLPEKTEYNVGKVQSISGTEFISDVELVDQSPIGRTPRSNPATYIKIFDVIRDLFSKTQSAKIHGYTPGHFSFNVPNGRCDVCEGSGIQVIEMQFLADLQLTCDACKGRRFKKEVLGIKYRNKNINEVLKLTVTEAIMFFTHDAAARRAVKMLKVLDDVGLGYIRLGQPATTLSGGEAQRIKLAAHLMASNDDGNKLFIFDEPTTGLHFDDISKLLKCFNSLIDNGNSVLIIEHNMDVIKCADWIIDLGPEAGNDGGYVVAVGTPEEISQNKFSHTGKILKNYL